MLGILNSIDNHKYVITAIKSCAEQFNILIQTVGKKSISLKRTSKSDYQKFFSIIMKDFTFVEIISPNNYVEIVSPNNYVRSFVITPWFLVGVRIKLSYCH